MDQIVDENKQFDDDNSKITIDHLFNNGLEEEKIELALEIVMIYYFLLNVYEEKTNFEEIEVRITKKNSSYQLILKLN